jgi:C-terminal processing protease CtpA/Prc
MGVIRSKVADRHFEFFLREEFEDRPSAPRRELGTHGLRTSRMLENGVAYLEWDGLPGDEAAMEVVSQTLAELPDMKATVFDIRDNIGGSTDMVILLCNHVLEANSLLCTFSDRSGGQPVEIRSSASERHFGTGVPVIVLTSGATIVGKRTAGMANPSRTYPVGTAFGVTVPFLITRYGTSGGTFAGVGVEPYISVPADDTLDVALDMAGKMLESNKRRQEMNHT